MVHSADDNQELDRSSDESEAEVDERPENAVANLELQKENGSNETREATEASQAAEESAKKRVIRDPQPKLDPDRICGKRGIRVLEDVFADFSARGQESPEWIVERRN